LNLSDVSPENPSAMRYLIGTEARKKQEQFFLHEKYTRSINMIFVKQQGFSFPSNRAFMIQFGAPKEDSSPLIELHMSPSSPGKPHASPLGLS
jgi:hypothetical protein